MYVCYNSHVLFYFLRTPDLVFPMEDGFGCLVLGVGTSTFALTLFHARLALAPVFSHTASTLSLAKVSTFCASACLLVMCRSIANLDAAIAVAASCCPSSKVRMSSACCANTVARCRFMLDAA